MRLDLASYTVSIGDVSLDLTIAEFRLLELLARQPGKVFSRTQIMERINGTDYFAAERSIDVQIAGITKKAGYLQRRYRDRTVRRLPAQRKGPVNRNDTILISEILAFIIQS